MTNFVYLASSVWKSVDQINRKTKRLKIFEREMKISSLILAVTYPGNYSFKIETQVRINSISDLLVLVTLYSPLVTLCSKEANGFLSRSKRGSSRFSFEELRSPDFQRECIEERKWDYLTERRKLLSLQGYYVCKSIRHKELK